MFSTVHLCARCVSVLHCCGTLNLLRVGWHRLRRRVRLCALGVRVWRCYGTRPRFGWHRLKRRVHLCALGVRVWRCYGTRLKFGWHRLRRVHLCALGVKVWRCYGTRLRFGNTGWGEESISAPGEQESQGVEGWIIVQAEDPLKAWVMWKM